MKGETVALKEDFRQAATEIFDKYFARAFKKKNNEPMAFKRFLRTIERAKKKDENFTDAFAE